MIYFDNAATSLPKPSPVMAAVTKAMALGNPGRSGHLLSLRASELLYSVREKVAELFSAPSAEGVVFTYNATEALNLAIKSLIKPNSHVIISEFEHNSVERPLYRLCTESGVTVDRFRVCGDTESSIRSLIKPNTTAIISTLRSNVTGERIDVETLSRISTELGLYLILDASQEAGHYPIDLRWTPADVLCAPGHKGLFGIQGIGFAVFKSNQRACGLVEGGSGTESINKEMPMLLPEGYEAGTPGTPAIAGLGAGIDFVNKFGITEIACRLDRMSEGLRDRLSMIPGVKVYSATGGIVTFNINGIQSSELALMLDEKGVCVRGGLHCAPSAHKRLGTLDGGAVRCSLSPLNTEKELVRFCQIIKDLL